MPPDTIYYSQQFSFLQWPPAKGMYEFVAESGKKYIGQTKDFYNRILTHLRGKLNPKNIDTLKVIEMPGSSSLERRVLEQKMIKAGGGPQPVGPLENKINSIKEADWPQYGIKP